MSEASPCAPAIGLPAVVSTIPADQAAAIVRPVPADRAQYVSVRPWCRHEAAPSTHEPSRRYERFRFTSVATRTRLAIHLMGRLGADRSVDRRIRQCRRAGDSGGVYGRHVKIMLWAAYTGSWDARLNLTPDTVQAVSRGALRPSPCGGYQIVIRSRCYGGSTRPASDDRQRVASRAPAGALHNTNLRAFITEARAANSIDIRTSDVFALVSRRPSLMVMDRSRREPLQRTRVIRSRSSRPADRH